MSVENKPTSKAEHKQEIKDAEELMGCLLVSFPSLALAVIRHPAFLVPSGVVAGIYILKRWRRRQTEEEPDENMGEEKLE